MVGAGVILATIAAVLLVMLAGAIARRLGVLDDADATGLGRLVADVTFPALCFKGIAGMRAEELARGWAVPLVGAASLGVGALVGALLAPLACGADKRARRTFVFCATMSNWIFLPLPLADALYADAGTAVVLLGNAGAQLFLWTIGLAILGGGAPRGARLLASPGLIATVAGIACALGWPGLVRLPVLAQALDLLGSATVPLATLAIGAQLAAPGDRGEAPPTRAIVLLVGARLVVAPVATACALVAWRTLDPVVRATEILVAAMPISLTAGALVARANGDVRLSSRAILVSTLLSALTVPAIHVAATRAAAALP